MTCSTPDRERLLNALRVSVSVVRLIESGDRLLGRGVSPEWQRAHSALCEVLDRCEAAGIDEPTLLAIINEGAQPSDEEADRG